MLLCRRFDVYVCTAAERQYALEVWRLLDIKGNIIPQAERRTRLVNVSNGRKKMLLRYEMPIVNGRPACMHACMRVPAAHCRLAGFPTLVHLPSSTVPQQAAPSHCKARPACVARDACMQAGAHARECVRLACRALAVTNDPSSRPLEWSAQSGGPPLPLTVVLDDRLDVWEEASQPCILQVSCDPRVGVRAHVLQQAPRDAEPPSMLWPQLGIKAGTVSTFTHLMHKRVLARMRVLACLQ